MENGFNLPSRRLPLAHFDIDDVRYFYANERGIVGQSDAWCPFESYADLGGNQLDQCSLENVRVFTTETNDGLVTHHVIFLRGENVPNLAIRDLAEKDMLVTRLLPDDRFYPELDLVDRFPGHGHDDYLADFHDLNLHLSIILSTIIIPHVFLEKAFICHVWIIDVNPHRFR